MRFSLIAVRARSWVKYRLVPSRRSVVELFERSSAERAVWVDSKNCALVVLKELYG